MNRKGYVFTLDAVLALIIIIVSLAILLSQLPEPTEDYYTDNIPTDIVNVLAYTDVQDLCTDVGVPASCECYQYEELEELACSEFVKDPESSVLELISEFIVTGAPTRSGAPLQEQVEEVIHEIFTTRNVIDEERFGYSLQYTFPGAGPVELYNTETYGVIT